MFRLLFYPILIFFIASCGQSQIRVNQSKQNEDSIKYVQASLSFFKQIDALESNDSTFILDDKPYSFDYYNCLEMLKSDTSDLSKKAVTIIKLKQLDSTFRWTNNYFPKIKIVRNEMMDSLFASSGWNSFKKNIGS